jgi:hypothetical protein
MTHCERLSERMPEVALLRATWSAEEAAHLEGCAECRDEWALVTAAGRLGERAPAMDPVAIAAAVGQRLAAERVARRRAGWVWAVAGPLAAAAAIALAVRGGPDVAPPAAPVAVAEAGPLIPLPELEGLETAQLDTLLQALDDPSAGTSSLESSTLGDGAEAEVERILATWEG